jgi:hypothetical protein
MIVETNEDFTRAWVDGVEYRDPWKIVSIAEAKELGCNCAEAPVGCRVFLCKEGYAFLERSRQRSSDG